MSEVTANFVQSKKIQIIEGVINKLKSCYKIEDSNEVNNEINMSIVTSLKKYFTGLRDYGGKFTLVDSAIESVLVVYV